MDGLLSAEAYSEFNRTSMMELCAKIVNDHKPEKIFAISSILDPWQGSGYALKTHRFKEKEKLTLKKDYSFLVSLLFFLLLFLN